MPEERDPLLERAQQLIGRDTRQDELPEVRAVLREFDERFFHIRNYGNDARIGEMKIRQYVAAEAGRVKTERTDRYLSARALPKFLNAYRGDKIIVGVDDNGKPIMKTKAEVWLDRPHRTYEEVGFWPMCPAPADSFNLWTNFAFEPVKGNCDRYLDHVYDNVCRKNDGDFKTVMIWMADAVRRPWLHANWAIGVHGEKGTGKNVFAEAWVDLFGEHGIVVTGEHSMTTNFNAHLMNKIAALADEALFANDPRQDRIIKAMVTGNTLRIEPKGIDSFTVPNYLHTIIIGNDEKIVHATAKERRYFVLECGDARRGDEKYFTAIMEQLRSGGYSALLYHLMNEVSETPSFNAPQTDDMKQHISVPPVEEVWLECLTSGRIPGRINHDGTADLKMNDLVDYAHRGRRRGWHELTYIDFTRLLGAKKLDLTKSWPISFGGELIRAWHIPTLEACRKNWDLRRYKFDWPDDGGAWEQAQGF